MDPELRRLVKAQKSRIPPDELAKIQDQIKSSSAAIKEMALERWQNMRPQDLRRVRRLRSEAQHEQFIKRLKEDLASCSPEDFLDMMRSTASALRWAEDAKKTEEWLFGKPGMIFLAICMLSSAIPILLHQLGLIGS